MRLLTRSKIYQAFPELDAYPVEQCERFVVTALESLGFKLAAAGLMILLLVGVIPLTLYGGAELASAISEDFFRRRYDGELTALFWMIGLVFFVACAFWVRDAMIGRRIRRLLRTQGRCGSCNYSLLGLSINPDLTIVCPECGLESKVDRALCELVLDESGRQSFRPREASPVSSAQIKKHPMRLITKGPIYRAFPELDSYDEEDCIVFLKSAKQSLWFRLYSLGMMSVLSIFGFGFTVLSAIFVAFFLHSTKTDSDARLTLSIVWLACGTFVTGVVVLRVRDGLIRRRILNLLRKQGRCRDCEYSLLGMPVSDDLTITCPECGMLNHVDPALCDLVRDDHGRQNVRLLDPNAAVATPPQSPPPAP